MSGTNQSSVSEFFLLGLSRQSQQQRLLFVLFLSMLFLAMVLGNLLIILAINTDSCLHTPMYFFLSSLSFVDICFTTVPKMLTNHILGTQTISSSGCLTQMYFVIELADMDNFLLAVMAYDRFVTVCHPLHYTAKMTHQLCALLAAGSWVVDNLNYLLHTLLMAQLSFCAVNTIPHIFCDAALVIIAPFLCVLASYMHNMCVVLKVPSTKGQWKAFSTCGSHLAVILFYAQRDTAAAVMFTLVTPMLKHFIYSMRNKDIKGALGKVV
uniref:Olfactory receptor family 1 subfamily F member 1 n=1 Tax=Cebus imitator TaxID=2715852 RepID=A0A2K5PNT6_CEBIM